MFLPVECSCVLQHKLLFGARYTIVLLQTRAVLLHRFYVHNVTDENDTRLMPRYEESRSWSHEEIWDLILNGGRNANPADVPMKTYDPLIKADYFTEGCR